MKESLLTDICEVQYGYAFDSKLFNDNEGLPVIRIRDVVRGYSETKTTEKCPDSYIINNGDILIGMDGEFNIARWKGGKALLNQRVCKLIPKYVNADYVLYYMPIALKAIEEKTPFVTVKHLSAKEINKICVPLPDEYQQQYISKSLALCDSLIFQNKLLLNKLDELIKSRFVEMFGNPITNSHRLPLKTLPELGELGRGVSKHRPRNAPELLGGVYPLIQTGDVANASLYILDYNSTYSEIGYKQSKMWNKGTLCITIAANIAKTAILTFDSCFPDSIVGFNANELANNVFIHFWFSFFQEILEEQAPESAQKNINLKILSELKVIVPSINLQNQFADFVAKVEQQKTIVQKSIEKLDTLKKSLMQEYFG